MRSAAPCGGQTALWPSTLCDTCTHWCCLACLGLLPCRCVLGMVELTLGFWLPVLASAVLEAREYRQWEQARQHAGPQGAGQQAGGRLPWGQRAQQRVYRVVNAMLDGQDPTGPLLAFLLLVWTWSLLALATPP